MISNGTVVNCAPLEFNNTSLLERVESALQQSLTAEIKRTQLPMDLQSVYSQERNQYYSTKLIADSLPITEGYQGKVLMMVDVDLYIPVFTYLFGEAQLNGRTALVSTCRLHEEFYAVKPNDTLLFTRTMKEVLHELGHTFGLKHCGNWDCIMHASLGVEEIDIKGEFFCDECRKVVPGYKAIAYKFL